MSRPGDTVHLALVTEVVDELVADHGDGDETWSLPAGGSDRLLR